MSLAMRSSGGGAAVLRLASEPPTAFTSHVWTVWTWVSVHWSLVARCHVVVFVHVMIDYRMMNPPPFHVRKCHLHETV